MRVIGVIALLCDAFMMFKKYENNDLVGVIFWGIWVLCVTMGLHQTS